jgi:hypothetical protein
MTVELSWYASWNSSLGKFFPHRGELLKTGRDFEKSPLTDTFEPHPVIAPAITTELTPVTLVVITVDLDPVKPVSPRLKHNLHFAHLHGL